MCESVPSIRRPGLLDVGGEHIRKSIRCLKDAALPRGCYSRSVVLEHDLVDDATAGSPELDTVFARTRVEEIKNLLIGRNRALYSQEPGVRETAVSVGCGRLRTRERTRTLRSASAPSKA